VSENTTKKEKIPRKNQKFRRRKRKGRGGGKGELLEFMRALGGTTQKKPKEK
jgi:hypothetical protein